MKKTFLCLLLLFSLFTTLAAQEVNEQYEQFSWEPVAKAKQYGVTIEKYDAADDIWKDYKEVTTKETQVEILFTPGIYRVAISTYNLMGRKGKASEWVQFKILEEHIPYLNDKTLPKSRIWNVPVLFLNKEGTTSSEDTYITPAEGYSENTILVNGRNIFSPKTEFYFVPKEQGGEQEFINFSDIRKEQKLKILSRNSKEHSVVVSYDPSSLKPGYYSLEVRNVGDNRASIDILVLDNTKTVINPDSSFEEDNRYNVNSLTVQNTDTYDFSILAKNINSATSFYFEPVTGTHAYPFESSFDRVVVPAEVKETSRKDNSNVTVTLSCSTEKLYTGYYNIVAKNWDGTTSKFICLVKRPFKNDYTKVVRTFRTKYNKKSELVEITLSDSVFAYGKKYTLVSEYDNQTDSNSRVTLPLTKSGRKLVGKISPQQLLISQYALMIEDDTTADVIYCTVDDTMKTTMNKMTQNEVEAVFLRPENKDTQIALNVNDAGAIRFIDHKVDLIKRMPYYFSNFRMDMGFSTKDAMFFDVEFDIFNIQWFSVSLGYEYITARIVHNSIYSMVRFAIPNKISSPFIGAGFGVFVDQPKKTDDIYYGVVQAGFNLFTVIDIKFDMFMYNLITSDIDFSYAFAVGFTFPLRSYKFKRKVLTHYGRIEKEGDILGPNFFEPTLNVDNLSILKGTTVGGFEGYNRLEQISIDTSVMVVEENAFRNCKELNTVTFEERENKDAKQLVIGPNAFANDTEIDIIYIPYRTKVISAGAFANWTNGQNIVLCWEKDDQTERDLTGLEDCDAVIHFYNGEIYHGEFKTPLDNQTNWVNINTLKMENVSVYYENNYVLGVRLRGSGHRWFKKELDTWINQESSQEGIDYLSGAQKLKFKVQGDGNTFDFIVTTKDGGYFYYTFKTKKGMLTEVEIPFNKFKKYSYSSQKQLDMDNIKMFCILPMCQNEWNEISLFDFEVIK